MDVYPCCIHLPGNGSPSPLGQRAPSLTLPLFMLVVVLDPFRGSREPGLADLLFPVPSLGEQLLVSGYDLNADVTSRVADPRNGVRLSQRSAGRAQPRTATPQRKP